MTDTTATKAEGLLDEAKGKVKDAVGGLTGDAKTQAEGKFDQVSGLAQQEFADLYDEGETKLEAATAFVQDRPLVSVVIAAFVGILIGALAFGRKG
ncbi:CsbD family protein [Neokomagataea anthophila]|uniref:CsbD family protein n=1 Tax=Neokomagataea anthophila TaxID=2826925 RepID=A0ABS5E5J4_9PROT|nr:CsbD family protein [Neokomagataea anthophila]MBR0559167.1 CsbD family protein [Neokomagataea anthophila]